MPILHQMQMSGNCYKVRLLAHQLGLPLEIKNYPLMQGDTRKLDFLRLNPNGRVPVLELEDGRVLAESNAILFYLSAGSTFQPENSFERASMLQWMFFEQYSHEPYIAVLRYLLAYAPETVRAKRSADFPHLRRQGEAALAVMDTHLSKREWLAGEHYSITDIALYGYTHCAGEGGFSIEAYPALQAWLERVAAQPNHIPL